MAVRRDAVRSAARLAARGRPAPSSGTQGHWDGQIDELQIFGYALTQAEIQAVRNNSRSVEPPLIQRSSYSLAGQTIATHVAGDPVSGNNGFFFILSDHLGSVSLLSRPNNTQVAGSTARYLPFGGWRTTPTAGLTDRGFTGHKHNNLGSNDLGLIYMNARYFVPSIGRFASADTLVPDPTNPQSFNRYTYGLNNPLRFTDPTGHCGEDVIWAWDANSQCYVDTNAQATADCIDIRDNLAYLYGVSITGRWTLAEMAILRDAFRTFRDALSDKVGITFPIQAIHDALKGTEIARERKQGSTITVCEQIICNLASNARTSARGGKITIFDGTFFDPGGVARDISRAQFTILHEIAHVLDNGNSHRFSDALKEAVGGKNKGCLIWCWGYEADGALGLTQYEDWANTFATFVTGGALDPKRYDFALDQLKVNLAP
jgi:RHS repeat-associated protein